MNKKNRGERIGELIRDGKTLREAVQLSEGYGGLPQTSGRASLKAVSPKKSSGKIGDVAKTEKRLEILGPRTKGTVGKIGDVAKTKKRLEILGPRTKGTVGAVALSGGGKYIEGQFVPSSAGKAKQSPLPESTIHYSMSEHAMGATHKAAKSGSAADHAAASRAHAMAHDSHVDHKYSGAKNSDDHHGMMADFHQSMAIHHAGMAK